ncbi:MAG: excinuclease ABC subunit UvrC [Holosporales bacterium]|jgi:excinuclease ABC subunit C
MPNTPTSLAAGVAVIHGYLATLDAAPGVYRMLNTDHEPLYIGKARNLGKRVAAYTKPNTLPLRLQRMIAETAAMEFIVCQSETEALLLECSLIKKLRPRYNVLLRDDKTYPYIFIRRDHPFPQILRHRGARDKSKGQYFGPFASASNAAEAIVTLQKIFQLRPCRDTVFNNRTRPCLQYHIKRCSAPCVGYIDAGRYGDLVTGAADFLKGKTTAVQEHLREQMLISSGQQDYEQAAFYRDRLKALTQVQASQAVHLDGVGDADIMAIARVGGKTCVEVFFYRGGSHYGNTAEFLKDDAQLPLEEVLSSFIGQFYTTTPSPPLILVNLIPAEESLLSEALSLNLGYRVSIINPQRGNKHTVVQAAEHNALQALARHHSEAGRTTELLNRLQILFNLPALPERIEVYDNSHIQGTTALGAMIVASPAGFEKKHYRLFRFPSTPGEGDDYAMLRQMLRRRFAHLDDGWQAPNLLLIDGGAGQLSTALALLKEMNLHLPVVAIAKGEDRNAGREWFFYPGKETFQLPKDDPLLYYLQRLRDEAHRFAVTRHRANRGKNMLDSSLDAIPGVGAKRKKALLLHFGNAKAVRSASITDLLNVPGIDATTATKIFAHFTG